LRSWEYAVDRNTKDVDARHKAGHDAKRVLFGVYDAFFFSNIDLMLSNNSILAPCLRIMTLCCSTESVLFQAQ
jgi:hypothetical protein